jgi:hypothetical protein
MGAIADTATGSTVALAPELTGAYHGHSIPGLEAAPQRVEGEACAP